MVDKDADVIGADRLCQYSLESTCLRGRRQPPGAMVADNRAYLFAGLRPHARR